MRSQRGSLTMFIAFVILPIIFFLFTLSMDLSVYYTRSQRAQKVIDEGVLYAHRFLPSKEDAAGVLDLYLKQNADSLGLPASPPSISVTADYIGVLYSGTSPLTFAGLVSDNSPIAFTYNVYSSARSTPLDIYLAFDASSYLAPDLFGNSPWGELNAAEWPAARYFEDYKQFLDPVSKDALPVAINPRLSTQQCFNEVFSAQKMAAIQIYDYLSSFNLNSIGLGFYPTGIGLDPTGLEIDEDTVQSLKEVRNVLAPGDRKNGLGEASFAEIGNRYQRSVFCAAAAEKENYHAPYKFPDTSTKMTSPVICKNSIEAVTNPSGDKFNQDYAPCVTAREAIWSSTVYSSITQDFPGAFEFMSSSLIGSSSRGTDRGGLIASVPKIAIILSGDLPRFGSSRFPDSSVYDRLTQKFNDAVSSVNEYGINFTLYQVIFTHRGVNNPSWESDLAAYKTFLGNYNNQTLSNGSLKIKLFVADSPLTVVQEIVSLILLEKRRVMISDKVL